MDKLLTTVLVVGMAYLGIVLIVYFSQASLMYAPATRRVLPNEAGLSNVQEITLVGAAGTPLYSWYGKSATDMPTFLFFHGNGGFVAGRTHKFTALMAAGYGVFMFGYPGYGGSDGAPSEPTFIEASGLAWDWLLSRGVSPERIVIYGESLGTADQVIPLASGRRLFEAANEPKQFHAIDGATHNDLYTYPVVELVQQLLHGIDAGQLTN